MQVLALEDVNEFENVSGYPRELTEEELKHVNGAWVANVAGAAVGGISAGFGAYAAGASWTAIGWSVAGGAFAGAWAPVSAFGTAARNFGIGAGGSFVGNGAGTAYF